MLSGLSQTIKQPNDDTERHGDCSASLDIGLKGIMVPQSWMDDKGHRIDDQIAVDAEEFTMVGDEQGGAQC